MGDRRRPDVRFGLRSRPAARLAGALVAGMLGAAALAACGQRSADPTDRATAALRAGDGGTRASASGVAIAARARPMLPARQWVIGGAETSRNIDVEHIDGVLATEVSVWPQSLAATPDGSLWIAEFSRLVRLDATGRLHVMTPRKPPAVDRFAVTAVGPDEVALAAGALVRRVRTDGSNGVLAGGGTESAVHDRPLPATSIRLIRAQDVATAPDGSIVIADAGRLLRVTSDGMAIAIAGDGSEDDQIPAPPASRDGTPAATARIRPREVAVAADGTVLFTESGRVRRIDAAGRLQSVALPGGEAADAVEVAPDGAVLVLGDSGWWRLGGGAPTLLLGADAPPPGALQHGRRTTGRAAAGTPLTFTADGSLVMGDQDKVVLLSSALRPPWLAVAIGDPTPSELLAGRLSLRTAAPARVTVTVSRPRWRFGEMVGRGAPAATATVTVAAGPRTVRLRGRVPAGLLVVRAVARDERGRTAVHERVLIAGRRLAIAAARLASELFEDDYYVHHCDRWTARAVDCMVAFPSEESNACCAARYRIHLRADGRVVVNYIRGRKGVRRSLLYPGTVIRLR